MDTIFGNMGAFSWKREISRQFSQTKWGIYYAMGTEVIIMHGYLLNNCSAHSVRLFSSNFLKRYFRFRQQFTGGEGATTISEVLIFKFMHEARLALSVCTVASRFPIGITSGFIFWSFFWLIFSDNFLRFKNVTNYHRILQFLFSVSCGINLLEKWQM